ncbi:hypothetical protein DKX38_019740 [Salix brachista]|uniref:Uncharacterized protein n=1 Tax=Salix brachista TaxID=2182728 RepID=A0A5N5KH27_9ROSI|nr:hypothetical protein DKX38_019740 [Salix brachista]
MLIFLSGLIKAANSPYELELASKILDGWEGGILIGNLWSNLYRSATNIHAIYWRSCGVDRWRSAIIGVSRGGIECLPYICERGECRQQLYQKEVRT